MKNIILIGTDTLHRRYIINSLKKKIKITSVIFEKNLIKPKFSTIPIWSSLENKFIRSHFSKKEDFDLKNINVNYVENLNSLLSVKILKNINPDYVIVSGARLIKGKVFEMIKNKSANVHLGNVLKYRGLDSNLWALYHKDYKNIGVTIHKLHRTLDTGNILAYRKIAKSKKFLPYKLKFYESKLAVDLLVPIIYELSKKKIKGKIQKQKGKYYSFMPKVLKDIL